MQEQHVQQISVTRSLLLLGVTSDGSQFVKSAWFDWTEEEMCIQMTSTSILSTQSLDIIFAVAGQLNSDRRLPPWCPDYLRFPSIAVSGWFASYKSGLNARYRLRRMSTQWNTTGQGGAVRDSLDIMNDKFLITLGVRHGIIKGLGTAIGSDEAPLQGCAPSSLPPGARQCKELPKPLAWVFRPTPREYMSNSNHALSLSLLLYDGNYRYYTENDTS